MVRHLLLALLFTGGLGLVTLAQDEGSLWTLYWQIPPDAWEGAGFVPPEKAQLDKEDRGAIGVAFSGGGTRAAAAAVGQLQGLEQNGWLEQHVRYISAVSGGSWTAVPFTYGTAGESPPRRRHPGRNWHLRPAA